MVFYRYHGRWVASEKLAREREELQSFLVEELEALLCRHHCERVDVVTWTHEPSDTVVRLCCLPRTKA